MNQSLSRAALETLSIIAYKQPITRVEVDDIRGVNSSGAITKLLSFDLIREDGKKAVSYTHLDVYKRQPRNNWSKLLSSWKI